MRATATLQDLLTFTFVISSMLGTGMSHALREVLAPLRNLGGVARALLVSFVVVPGLALLLTRLVSEPEFAIALVLLGAGSGSPFVLKLTDVAQGDVPLSVTLLGLWVITTVVYMPIVLPLFLGDVQVDALAIARQLGLQLLLPLGIGHLARWRYAEGTRRVLPVVHWIANVSLVLLIGLMLITNARNIVRMVGTGAIASLLLLVLGAMVAGWVLGGPGRATRVTMALGAGHRNYAAAFVVASGSFSDQPLVLVFLACAAPLNMVMSFVLAGELRRRHVRRVAGGTGRAPDGQSLRPTAAARRYFPGDDDDVAGPHSDRGGEPPGHGGDAEPPRPPPPFGAPGSGRDEHPNR